MHSWRFHTFSAPDIGPFSPRFRTRLPAPCGTGPPPDFLWVLQGFSPGPCVQNKPLGFSCLGLRAVLTASRLFTRTGSVASRLSRNPTRNPIPSCTSLFRALPRHPIGHCYQRLSLLPFQRLQGILPVRQCSRCCHPNYQCRRTVDQLSQEVKTDI